MARDELFADVRRAVTFMAPRVQADSPFTEHQLHPDDASWL